MKYFTKEFNELEWLSYTNMYAKKSKNAEKKDEKFYKRVYDKRCADFVDGERTCDWYRDPLEDLRKIDEYVNEPGISDEERSRRMEYRKLHVYLHKKQIERGKPFEFDEELAKRGFENSLKEKTELYSKLPQEILDKIADMRVFVMGYASAEVKQLLRPYCAKLKRYVKQVKEKACVETNEAESCLKEYLDFIEYDDKLITKLEEKGGDLYLKGADGFCLLFKNGKVLEGSEKTIFPYSGEKPNEPWSRIIAAELHRVNGVFEAHFLLSCYYENHEYGYEYLTIQASDIVKIVL